MQYRIAYKYQITAETACHGWKVVEADSWRQARLKFWLLYGEDGIFIESIEELEQPAP